MPQFHTLSESEVSALKTRRTNLADLDAYIQYLGSLNQGDWGSVELEQDKSKRVIKRRMSTAARSVGKEIRWRRQTETSCTFEVIAVPSAASSTDGRKGRQRSKPIGLPG